MGPQGEIEIGLCGRHTRRVQSPEARSSSWVFYLLSSGGEGRQPSPPSNRPAGAKPGSIPGRAANPERGISNRKEVNSLLRCFLSQRFLQDSGSSPDGGSVPTREKTAGHGGACRGRIRPWGSLSQEAENPAHNRVYPGSRPGGTTRKRREDAEFAFLSGQQERQIPDGSFWDINYRSIRQSSERFFVPVLGFLDDSNYILD